MVSTIDSRKAEDQKKLAENLKTQIESMMTIQTETMKDLVS